MSTAHRRCWTPAGAIAAVLCAWAAAAAAQPIAPGEVMYIEVHRHPDITTTTQVDETGNVQMPYVGKVTIGGLSEGEAGERVAQALTAILRSPRVTVSRAGRPGRAPGQRTAEMRTEIVPLHNSRAEVLQEALAGMVSPGGNIGADPGTNALIVTDNPMALQNIMSVIMQLDQMQTQVTQVHIETKIAEVEDGALKELGVRWFAQGARLGGGHYPNPRQNALVDSARTIRDPLFNERIEANVSGNQFGTTRRFIDEGNFDRRFQIPVQVPAPGQMFMGYMNSGIDLGVLLDALVSNNKAEMLAAPYIRTVNHKPASIRMIQEFPFQEFGNVGLNTFTSTRFLDIGIVLEVTPHVRRDGDGVPYVQLELDPEVSFATGIANGIPIRSVRGSSSVANVRDGQTLVIGGIIQSDMREVIQKVPGLGSIPVFGHLFRHTEKSEGKRELMIFVTPTVLDRPEDSEWDRTMALTDPVHEGNPLPLNLIPAEQRKD